MNLILTNDHLKSNKVFVLLRNPTVSLVTIFFIFFKDLGRAGLPFIFTQISNFFATLWLYLAQNFIQILLTHVLSHIVLIFDCFVNFAHQSAHQV